MHQVTSLAEAMKGILHVLLTHSTSLHMVVWQTPLSKVTYKLG